VASRLWAAAAAAAMSLSAESTSAWSATAAARGFLGAAAAAAVVVAVGLTGCGGSWSERRFDGLRQGLPAAAPRGLKRALTWVWKALADAAASLGPA
jgi:hypothetical protein